MITLPLVLCGAFWVFLTTLPLPHFDEGVFIWCPLGLWGDLNPHFFNYPTFPFYVLAVVYKLHQLTLGQDAVGYVAYRYFVDGTDVLGLARIYAALSGVAAMWLATRISRTVWGESIWVLMTAVTMAFMPIFTRLIPVATTDMLALPWIAASLLYALRYVAGHPRRDLYVAAAFAGVAAANKFPAGLVLVATLTALYVRPGTMSRRERTALLPGVVGVTALVLIILSPYLLLDFASAYQSLSIMTSEHLGGSSHRDYPSLARHLLIGLGLPLVVTVAWLWRWEPPWKTKEEVVLLSTTAAFLLFVLASSSTFQRYWLPVALLMAIWGGRALHQLFWEYPWWSTAAAAAQAVLITSQALTMLASDSRVDMARVINKDEKSNHRYVLLNKTVSAPPTLITPAIILSRLVHFGNSYSIDDTHKAMMRLSLSEYPYPLAVLWGEETVEGLRPKVGEEDKGSSVLMISAAHPLVNQYGPTPEAPPEAERIGGERSIGPSFYDMSDWLFYPEGILGASRIGPTYSYWYRGFSYRGPMPTLQEYFILLGNNIGIAQAVSQKRWEEAVALYQPFRRFAPEEVLSINMTTRLYIRMAAALQHTGREDLAGEFAARVVERRGGAPKDE